MNKKFSERYGFKETKRILQTKSISTNLKNQLWNVLYLHLFLRYHHAQQGENSGQSFLNPAIPKMADIKYNDRPIHNFVVSFWFEHLKLPLDEFPKSINSMMGETYTDMIKKYFLSSFKWHEIYDFLEYTVAFFESQELIDYINKILKQELSGWRFIGTYLSQITSEKEVEMLEEAINDDKYKSVSEHLRQSLVHMSNRRNPDYRNSIKESISAVESLARIITNNPKATLGQALGKIEDSGKLHPSLKVSFSALYGYTSDEHGIRHSMLEEPNLTITIDDAKFFLLSCTSFINYLKTKM